MAAPAGGGGSAVSVLAPNGRRHTVKVTPSTVLLQVRPPARVENGRTGGVEDRPGSPHQGPPLRLLPGRVLEDTCRRQDFNPGEYDLNLCIRFQRTVLDLSLQWRFANLPNNAKLEMVPASRSREGPENTVRIALQLDDGSRLQDAFCSRQTLWELLSHFAQTRCRARVDCSATYSPPSSLRIHSEIDSVDQERERLQQLGERTPVCVYMRDEVTGRAALQNTTLQSLGLTGGSATIRFVIKQCDVTSKQESLALRSKAPGSPVSSVSADQASSSPLLPLNSGEFSRGDLNHQGDASTSATGLEGGPKPVDAQTKQSTKEPASAPFVPFSGGGQRLGGPSVSLRPLTSPSAKSSKSFSGPGGPSKPKKSKPGEEPPQEPEPLPGWLPVDRDPVVCHPDLEDLLQPWPAEVPDEFFEVTVDDVRRRLAQLKSERKRLEEAPLVTKAFREAQMKEKLERYPKVALRVLFPDRYILQGFFRPSETVGDLRDFVRSHLGNPELSFYLFIAPPKTVLDDHTLTLFQANLFPAALVHFGAEEPTGLYLEPGLLEHTVSPSTADVLVARCMSRAAGSPPLLPAPDPVSLESEPIAEEGALGPPEPIQGTAQPVKRSLGKVPKWLKLPASKR
ncbi:Tether containing UBX domain for GLUT4 [Apodemus speciosus]|uniref:Tether containing UBX domain for GLUT4 n=1 Tax=Apodemus speciosus TaxID=105296 RepID=A0ABQ0FDG7_APOSI